MTKPFEEALRIAKKNLDRSSRELEKTLSIYASGNIEAAYKQAFSYADASETQVLDARSLPAYTGFKDAKRRMDEQVRTIVPIEIHESPDNDWFRFIIPSLLPKKESGSALYIRLSLYNTLAHHFRERTKLRISDCVIVVRHLYDAKRPEREYRDHDNIDLNAVIDAITFFILTDDSPLRCRHYYCSRPAKDNATEILLLPDDCFMRWLVAENCGSGIVREEQDIHEKKA